MSATLAACSTASSESLPTSTDALRGGIGSASAAAINTTAARPSTARAEAGSSVDPAHGLDTLNGVPPPLQITTTTLYKSPLVIEGLTADSSGNFYTAGRVAGSPCPVWRVSQGGAVAIVGNVAAPCNPSGLAFTAGDLFIADGDKIERLTPNDQAPATASVFIAGIAGANGVAFDRSGNLWVSDGTSALGRVWRATPDGAVTEMFRVQPLANDINVRANPDAGVGAGVGGIGRDMRLLPPGSITVTPTARMAADTAGSQSVVANGVAFAADGSLFIADTARGAIWKVLFDDVGNIKSALGCDTTFTANTLCLENVLVAHPMLEGLDGIAVDGAGNIWGVASERNAVVVVTERGRVREVFRNAPDPTTMLRNGGPLEYPASPFFVDRKLCVTQTDANRRDNAPSSAGEVGPGVAGPLLGKISCLDPPMPHPGLPLPPP